MASIFRKDDKHVEKHNRNVFSKTFAKSLTARFGELIPVFCQPVMNGESVQIKHKHNFNFLPLVFPVQTRVRASIRYFYCRNRPVWKDWEDFQFKMKPNLTPPYLKFTSSSKHDMLRVGGFCDNIGCPVTILENVGKDLHVEPKVYDSKDSVGSYNPYTNTIQNYKLDFLNSDFVNIPNNSNFEYLDFDSLVVEDSGVTYAYRQYRYPVKPVLVNSSDKALKIFVRDTFPGVEPYLLIRCVRPTNSAEYSVTTDTELDSSLSSTTRLNSTIGDTRLDTTSKQIVKVNTLGEESRYFIFHVISDSSNTELTLPRDFGSGWKPVELLGYYQDVSSQTNYDHIVEAVVNPADYVTQGGIHVEDLALKDLPYANTEADTDKHIRVSAFPSRHFESVYNAWYRHPENNPYKINGVTEYNKYISNNNGGADTTIYPRRYDNWQDDAFTTALHSPQHGDAPLVGLVNGGVPDGFSVTFANDDGTTNRVRFVTSANSQNPGAARALYLTDATGNGSPSSPSDGYVGQLQEAMIEAVKFGITINDFRNVNSFQRWLENNVARGYKYRDQIKSHFGVSVRYDTLQMPEYLGGTTRDMNVTQVTQTVENENGVLGDYAGQAWIEGGSEHEINHYCDEEGYIIGILSIMPVASYSQIIPKHLLRRDAFDYYSTEFGKIGMQPILNRELSPLASFYRDNGDKIFGYQRAWYDYLDCPDTLHGKFRTQFRNFVINRVFDNVPTLSEDFLVYNPDSVNNVFYVDDDEDKILGQILFDYSSRMPIPIYGTPALE